MEADARAGHFVPTSWQALPEGTDPTAAGWRPGVGLYFGKGTSIQTYNFATNVLGAKFTPPGVSTDIVGIAFTDAATALITTATTNTAAGRTTATSDSTITKYTVSGSTFTKAPGWTFPLASVGIPGGAVDDDGMIDARDLAVVGDTLYVSDGYDSRRRRPPDLRVHVGFRPVGFGRRRHGGRGHERGCCASASRCRPPPVGMSPCSTGPLAPGAPPPSSDYTTVSGTLTIPAGAASGSFNVPVRGDSTVEDKESFGVRLSNPVGAGLGRAGATGRILNDDVSSGLKVAIGDASVVEGTSGTRSLRLTVSLSGVAATTVPVSYATAGKTAASGTDFVARTGTVSIPAGGTSTSFTVSVRGDTTVESNETFTVRLSNTSGAIIGRTTGVATVLNDD